MQDPYDILGVRPDASDDEIKSVYHRLAKQYHPDRRPDDSAHLQRFQEINAAYDMLKDPARRRKYDRFGAQGGFAFDDFMSPKGKPHTRTRGGFADWEDILKNSNIFFGEDDLASAPKKPKTDVSMVVEIDFADAVLGCKKQLHLDDGKTVNLSIPSGVKSGTRLRLRGQGKHGGDSYAEIFVKPDRKFQRIGRNIVTIVPISIDEAVLGGKIRVETLTGTVEVMVPPNSSSGHKLRLKGRGLPSSKTQLAGDFMIELQILLPDSPDSALEAAIASWKKARERY